MAAEYNPRDNTYEDVNIIRARKAKERDRRESEEATATNSTVHVYGLHFVCRSIVPIKSCLSIIMASCV